MNGKYDETIFENKNVHWRTQILKKANLKKEKKRKELINISNTTEKLNTKTSKLEAKAFFNRHSLKFASDTWRNTSYPGVDNYILYSSARLELFELHGIKRLNSKFGPVINDVLSIQYPLSIPLCEEINMSRSFFIAVISAPENFEKRKIIRKTWKNHLKGVQDDGSLRIAGFAFILGLTKNYFTQEKIKGENFIHRDIIQIGIPDFYRNLSFKFAGLLNWLYRNCMKVDFILKLDDDVYVNVRNLVHFVQSNHQANQSVYGVGDPNGGVPDRGK
jgi:hypothetical protein